MDAGSLDTWAVDAGNAQQYLVRHYVERVSFDNWHIRQRQDPDGGKR